MAVKQPRHLPAIRYIFIFLLGLTLLVGCQAVTTTPIASKAPIQTPAGTLNSTTAVPEVSTSTWTPPPVISTSISTSPPTSLADILSKTAAPPVENLPIVLVGRLIDGTGAEPVKNAVVIIQDGRIIGVGTRQEIEIPPDAIIIELGDATILPGFINAHVHNAYSAVLLEKWAQAGVTTVRDLGARYPFLFFPTRDRNNRNPNFATVISAGPLITVPGGYPIAGNNFPSLTVTSPDHACREVTELIQEGADVIKIVIESGAGYPTLSLATATAIVETAHQFNVPVTVHITTLDDLKVALAAGVDDIAHIVPSPVVSPDVLEQMIAEDVYWVPTLEPFGGHGEGNLGRFVAVGGKVALGNDSGLLPGIEIGMPMREIEMMADAGMSPMQIIVAATQNAAHVCNRGESLGTIEAGKTADILVVNGDPLDNLQALKDVRLVIHHGVIIRDITQ